MKKKILGFLAFVLVFTSAYSKEYKYHPKDEWELKKLVLDLDVNLGEIDISEFTDMSLLFEKSERTDFSGIETWDTSKVTNMAGMFYNATNFNQNINSWDTSNVIEMLFIFKFSPLEKNPPRKWYKD